MMDDCQNNAGFLKTKLISNKSLISGIPNFDFNTENALPSTDSDLELPPRLMLGKRAERYFSEWIKHSPIFDLVSENIQIIEDKQTLGEFDFIIQRKSDNQLIHVELIYKFYLFDPLTVGSETKKWIGPNRGDRLDFKLNKLKDHQFPLLHSVPAKKRLSELGLDTTEMTQQVVFLANLFVPRNQEVEFTLVNKKAVEGTWMNLKEWEVQSSSENRFAIPEKKDWFSREFLTDNWLTKDEALEKIKSFHEQKRSPLVWSNATDGCQSRDFVVWW